MNLYGFVRAEKIVQEGRLDVPLFCHEFVSGGKGECFADSFIVRDGAGDDIRVIVDMWNLPVAA